MFAKIKYEREGTVTTVFIQIMCLQERNFLPDAQENVISTVFNPTGSKDQIPKMILNSLITNILGQETKLKGKGLKE